LIFVGVSVEGKGVMGDPDAKFFLYRFFDLLNTGITKFQDLSVININEMIMLFEPVRFFELSAVVSKLVLCNKIAIKEQFDGIV
jgi:hypothetical protein